MKTGIKILCIASLAVILIMAAAGCGSGKPSLVGTWRSDNDANNTIQFTKDGNLIVEINGKLASGTYEVLSDTVVKVNVSGVTGLLEALFSAGTWEYTVTSTTLSLSGNKLTRTFTRE